MMCKLFIHYILSKIYKLNYYTCLIIISEIIQITHVSYLLYIYFYINLYILNIYERYINFKREISKLNSWNIFYIKGVLFLFIPMKSKTPLLFRKYIVYQF